MKVAWIVPGFSRDERDWCIPALLDMTRVLAARHELHVFALRYPYRRDRYTVYGAQVHAVGGGHRGWWTLPVVWRSLAGEIAREHAAAPFDAVHAFWLYEPGVIAAFLKRRLRWRTIVSLGGGELIALPSIGYGLWHRRLLRGAMRWALRRADIVCAGSTGLLDRTRSVIGAAADEQRFVFAPLGVDVSMFSPGGPPAAKLHRLINVGSLQPVKGQADLITAFRFVVDRIPDAQLEIVGAGELRSNLEQRARRLGVFERVAFTGEVRRERLPDRYRQAAAFVQASRHEAQGMAMLEAAACGLPVVGTAVGALADLAPEAAVATPPGDPLRLAQALLTVMNDANVCRALGQAARARVEAAYALETTVARFEALYARP